MSLLSDLLSKIRHPEPRKDVPPGLRSTVTNMKKKGLQKKLMILLPILLIIVVGSTFLISHFITDYLKEEKLESMRKPPEPVLPSPPVETEVTQIIPEEKIDSAKEEIKKEELKKEVPSPRPSQRKALIPEAPTQEEKTKKEETKSEDIMETQPPVQSKVQSSEKRDLYLYIGENYERKRDYYNAISHYKKVIDIEPENYRVMNKIAYILIQIGSYDEALKYLENAFRIRHDYVPALINTGIVYARQEKFTDAENFFLKALALEEINQKALFNLALLYEKQRKYDLARQYYSRLKALGNEEGRQGIERIGSR